MKKMRKKRKDKGEKKIVRDEDKEEESDNAEHDVKIEEGDSSATESDGPLLIFKTSHIYALRQREGKKFPNTEDTLSS